MYSNVISLIYSISLLRYSFAENSRRRPIIDLQHAEPRILGAASRDDVHPGPNSPTIVYYPSVPVIEGTHDNMDDQDENGSSSSTVYMSLESDGHSTHPFYGYSDYSMVSSMRNT